ncbi:MAG: hypothetical protein QM756_05785 [Polyangiaceae bacterium]
MGCSSSKQQAANSACDATSFCDDFEAYAAGAAPQGSWQTRLKAGTVSVDETRAHSGARSVRFATDAASGTKTAFMRVAAPVLPLAGNVVFGRMYMYLESAPETSVHFTLLQGVGLIEGQSYRAMYRYGGQQPLLDGQTFVGSRWMANYETPDSYSGTGPSSDCWDHSAKSVVPVGRWACVEWQFDGPANTMRLWQDGVALEDVTAAGKGEGCVNQPALYPWTAPRFEQLELGFESYQTDAARVLYVDDVAVADHRIGCE